MQRLNGWSLSDFSATNFWPNLANPANQRTCLSIIISSNALVNVSIVIIESSLKSNSQVCESHSLNKLGFQLPSKSNQNCVSCLVLIWGSFSSPDNRVIEQVAVTQNKKLCGQDEDKQASTDLLEISKSPTREKLESTTKHLCCLSLVVRPARYCQLMGGDCIATGGTSKPLVAAPELNIVSTATALCASIAPTLSLLIAPASNNPFPPRSELPSAADWSEVGPNEGSHSQKHQIIILVVPAPKQ